MTPATVRRLPWAPDASRLVLRGHVVVRLRPGWELEHVPAHDLVRQGRSSPTGRLDGGSLDTLVGRHSAAQQVSRSFRAARGDLARGGGTWDGVEHDLGLSRTFRLRVEEDASLLSLVQDLREHSAVEMATPMYLCDTPFAAPTRGGPVDGHGMVGVDEALSIEPGDSAVIVGVIDSGVALDHPELDGRLRPGFDTVDLPRTAVSRGLHLFGDTRGRDRRPDDEMGHGTACASIISARGEGVPRGVGGAARVLPLRALAGARASERTSPTAVGGLADIDHAVKVAVDLGARVLNLSFGTPQSSLRNDDPVPHVEVIRYALARGCVLVAASGNSGDDTAYFPAALPGVIAVGAVGADRRPTRFMTRGEHVALCAPGERINAAGLQGYGLNTGTSFAAPYVAGAAALLLARGNRAGVPLSAEQIRALLVDSTRPFPADQTGCGRGVLDLPAALRAAEALLGEDAAAEDAGAGIPPPELAA